MPESRRSFTGGLLVTAEPENSTAPRSVEYQNIVAQSYLESRDNIFAFSNVLEYLPHKHRK